MGKDNCAVCGKELGRFSVKRKWNSEHHLRNNKKAYYRQDLHGKILCFSCLRKLDNSAPLCSRCAFYSEHEEPFDEDGSITVRKCERFNFEAYQDNEAKLCSSYVNKDEYREKALKGEIASFAALIPPETALATCQFCGTRYNLKKESECPKCGGQN